MHSSADGGSKGYYRPTNRPPEGCRGSQEAPDTPATRITAVGLRRSGSLDEKQVTLVQ